MVADKSTAELQARFQSWRSRKESSGTAKKTNFSSEERNPMSVEPEEIQPIDPQRSMSPNKQREQREAQKGAAMDLVLQGVEYHQSGEFELAIRSFQEALKLQTIVYGGDHHAHVAHTLSNIGSVYLRQGKLPEAQEALLKALDIKEQLRGKCQDENEKQKIVISDVLNNLGNLAYLQGNYTTSMQFYRQNLRELRRRGVPDDDLASTLHNIGRLHVIRQEWDAAFTILTQCQSVEETLYGPKSPKLADTLELIGYVHLTHKSYDNAMIAFSDALSIHQQNLGAVHENVATALINVAMVMEGQGNLKHACQTYQTARDVFREIEADKNHRGFLYAQRGYEKLKIQLRNEKKNRTSTEQQRQSELHLIAEVGYDQRESENSLAQGRDSQFEGRD
jgi:tetratricopeptide (TPR) repeat protein